jgi:hypothetical protein
MTKHNAAEWWSVVKDYLNERWEEARAEFAPLIAHLDLKLSNKTPYESTIKSRVIDNDLQDAFMALVRHNL